jgi:ADP-heptose:LPS heptosyltransferase
MCISAKKNNLKILVIQFKYLGDAVFITPAIQALHQQYPDAELHILVAAEVAPIFNHLPFIKKVWAFPRTRGKAKLMQSLPFVLKLRKENFDTSIDFGGNDRGRILSLLINAKTRIGVLQEKFSVLQKLSYNKAFNFNAIVSTWVNRNLELVMMGFGIKPDKTPKLTIKSSPLLSSDAKKIINGYKIICHIGTSQQKKEWPIKKWYQLYELATKAGYKIIFSAGSGQREQNLLKSIKDLDSNIPTLPSFLDLSVFLAVLNQAELVISGDTGPLHLASGLGKKIIGLFAVDDGVRHYAPIYSKNEVILGKPCTCIGELVHFASCQSASHCMNSISAEQVFELLKQRYPLNGA